MVTRLLERWLLLEILPTAKPDLSEGATAMVLAIPNQAIQEKRKTSVAAGLPGLRKRFSGERVLTEIDLEVAEYELVVVVGRSGSGDATAADPRAFLLDPPPRCPWEKIKENRIAALTTSAS